MSAMPNPSARNLRAEHEALRAVAAASPSSVTVCGVTFHRTDATFADYAIMYAGHLPSGTRQQARLSDLRLLGAAESGDGIAALLLEPWQAALLVDTRNGDQA